MIRWLRARIYAAVGALYGPLHGGANEAVLRMLERIGTKDKVPAFVEGVKNKKEKMFGFGHRCAAWPLRPWQQLTGFKVKGSSILKLPCKLCSTHIRFQPSPDQGSS